MEVSTTTIIDNRKIDTTAFKNLRPKTVFQFAPNQSDSCIGEAYMKVTCDGIKNAAVRLKDGSVCIDCFEPEDVVRVIKSEIILNY